MRRFINRYGIIESEYKRDPYKSYPPYRKGSYFVSFYSEILGLSISAGHVNRYETYKEIVKEIRQFLKNNGESCGYMISISHSSCVPHAHWEWRGKDT